jgi:hypothetical protein
MNVGTTAQYNAFYSDRQAGTGWGMRITRSELGCYFGCSCMLQAQAAATHGIQLAYLYPTHGCALSGMGILCLVATTNVSDQREPAKSHIVSRR